MRRTLYVLIPIAALVSCAHNSSKALQRDLTSGRRFYDQGKYADAEIWFRKATQEDPKSGEAQWWAARASMRQQKQRDAFDAFNRAVALLPLNDGPKTDLMNLLLDGYIADKDHPRQLFDQISHTANELLAKDPGNFDGLRAMGYLTMTGGAPAKAIEFFEHANSAKPGQADVVTALVESLSLDGQTQRSDQVALDFLKTTPNCGPLYTVLYHNYMGRKLIAEAEAVLKSKVEHNPRESSYRVELARHYWTAGNKKEAAAALDALLADTSRFPRARLEIGDFYAANHDFTTAILQYEAGLRADPSSHLIYWKRMVPVRIAMKDRAAAGALLVKILAETPEDVEARASRADLWMLGSDPADKKRAVEEFRALSAAQPENLGLRMQYAAALRATGDYDSAIPQYAFVVQRQPKNVEALLALADLSIRGAHSNEALEYAARALSINPRNIEARLIRSSALAVKGDFEAARVTLTDLTREFPNLREAQLQLALLDVEEKRFPDAERHFRQQQSKAGPSDPRVLRGLVEVYRAQNRLQDSIPLLQQEVTRTPQSAETREILANTAAEASQMKLAIANYEILKKQEPASRDIALRLGLAYQSQGDFNDAIAEFDRASKLDAPDGLTVAYLAKALQDAGRAQEAIREYRRSLTLDNRNPWVMNNLAYLLAEEGGDLKDALTLAQRANHSAPGNPAFADTLGWVYLKSRNYASAIQLFASLRDKHPENPAFHLHLVEALLSFGQRGEALAALRGAERLTLTGAQRAEYQRLISRAQ